MINMAVKFFDSTPAVKQAADKAARAALYKAAYAILQTAKASIVQADGPAAPGQPPHTRRGQLRRAIRYEVDRANLTAVIGAAASQMGPAAEPMEHGGRFRGASYPARPFMEPALEANRDQIPAFLAATVNDSN